MAKTKQMSKPRNVAGKTETKPTAKQRGAGTNGRSLLIGGTIAGVAVLIAVFVIVIAPLLKSGGAGAFNYSSFPMLGNKAAPVKIVEFGDFKCPACKYFHDNVFPQLKAQYIDNGVVQFYFANFPFIGPDSTTAAIAGEAIFHQNPAAFWDYYNAIYTHQENEQTDWATPSFLVNLARTYVPGINYQKLAQEIADNAYSANVTADYQAGTRAGVDSTPTLFINGHKFLNFSDWPALQAAIAQYK